MKSFLIAILAVCLTSLGQTQTIDNEQFKSDIIALYDAGMISFKNNKDGEALEDNGGVKKFKANLPLNGAKEIVIEEDAEGNYKYRASYTLKNIRNPKAKVEEIALLIAEATTDLGLEKASKTDVKYIGYTKHIIEFPADNIDDMGKHTSFTVGMTMDGNPMSFEIVVTEILWK